MEMAIIIATLMTVNSFVIDSNVYAVRRAAESVWSRFLSYTTITQCRGPVRMIKVDRECNLHRLYFLRKSVSSGERWNLYWKGLARMACISHCVSS